MSHSNILYRAAPAASNSAGNPSSHRTYSDVIRRDTWHTSTADHAVSNAILHGKPLANQTKSAQEELGWREAHVPWVSSERIEHSLYARQSALYDVGTWSAPTLATRTAYILSISKRIYILMVTWRTYVFFVKELTRAYKLIINL